jgi:hypothetical protein
MAGLLDFLSGGGQSGGLFGQLGGGQFEPGQFEQMQPAGIPDWLKTAILRMQQGGGFPGAQPAPDEMSATPRAPGAPMQIAPQMPSQPAPQPQPMGMPQLDGDNNPLPGMGAPRPAGGLLPPQAMAQAPAAPGAPPPAAGPAIGAPAEPGPGLLQRLAGTGGIIGGLANTIGAVTGQSGQGVNPETSTGPAGQVYRLMINQGVAPQMAKVMASQKETALAWLQNNAVKSQARPLSAEEKTGFGLPEGPWFMGADGKPALPEGFNGLQPKTSDDIREYEYAKKNDGFKGTFEQWMARKRGGAGEYGLQPIWGTGTDGKPAIIQLGKSGEAIQTKLPDGIQVGKDVIKIDAGTHTVLLDPVTRAQIGIIPKNIEATKVAEAQGEAQGAGKVALPGVEDKTTIALKTIKQIREHPGRDWGTGLTAALPSIPGTDTRGFVNLVEQAKGQTFLQAFESLKGAGAITEIEGSKATQAIARLDRAQSKKDFDSALNDLEEVIHMGVRRARAKAGGGAPAAAAPGGGGAPGLPPPPPGFNVVQ